MKISNRDDEGPGFFFFVNDWRSAPEASACSLLARGLWIEMLSLMQTAPRRGCLTWLVGEAEEQIQADDLASQVKRPLAEVKQGLEELEIRHVFTREADGTIYCRRWRREAAEHESKVQAGRAGGKARAAQAAAKQQGQAEPQAEIPSKTQALSLPIRTLPIRTVPSLTTEQITDLLEKWNALASELSLPAVRKLSKGRLDKLRLRMKEWQAEGGLDVVWPKIAEGARRWKFGQGEKGWRFNLDYLLANDTNWHKMVERAEGPAGERTEADIAAQQARELFGEEEAEQDGKNH